MNEDSKMTYGAVVSQYCIVIPTQRPNYAAALPRHAQISVQYSNIAIILGKKYCFQMFARNNILLTT